MVFRVNREANGTKIVGSFVSESFFKSCTILRPSSLEEEVDIIFIVTILKSFDRSLEDGQELLQDTKVECGCQYPAPPLPLLAITVQESVAQKRSQ